ncbi:YezD family protein [Peribacillus simplex]|uniref:YezD family protein n=1 Tax=Peribacillus simplex TaxID=1478 RepID=UPI003D2A9DE7
MEKKEELKFRHILSSLEDLQYGSVIITVHDGEITQVDTTEKKRFPVVKGRSVKTK